MSKEQFATNGESPDEWYEREKTAFRAWRESDDNEKTFSSTPTMAAGAGWFARAEAAPETAPIVPCLAPNGCTTPEWCARNGDACRVKTPVSETAQKPSCIYRTGCETPNDCREHGYCRSPRNAAPQEAPAARPAMEGSGDSQSTTRPTQPSSVEPAVAAPVSVPSAIGQKKDWGRAKVGLDGDHGYALLGEDLQSGEAEFSPIEGWPTPTYKQERAAWGLALKKLEERLGSGLLRYEVIR